MLVQFYIFLTTSIALELIDFLGFYNSIFGNIVHYVSMTDLVPAFRLTSLKTIITIWWFIPQSLLRQVHSLLQSEFSTHCHLVLLLSIYSILSFSEGHPVAAYVFSHVFPLLLSFFLSFHKQCVIQVHTQNVTNPITLSLCVEYSFPPWLYIIPLHFSHDLSKLISIRLQHHISKLSSYFWSTCQSVQFSAPCNTMLQM
jgi:hypothetical protein